jgi:hypothetical protein
MAAGFPYIVSSRTEWKTHSQLIYFRVFVFWPSRDGLVNRCLQGRLLAMAAYAGSVMPHYSFPICFSLIPSDSSDFMEQSPCLEAGSR